MIPSEAAKTFFASHLLVLLVVMLTSCSFVVDRTEYEAFCDDEACSIIDGTRCTVLNDTCEEGERCARTAPSEFFCASVSGLTSPLGGPCADDLDCRRDTLCGDQGRCAAPCRDDTVCSAEFPRCLQLMSVRDPLGYCGTP